MSGPSGAPSAASSRAISSRHAVNVSINHDGTAP
jgi:hypothetical protein